MQKAMERNLKLLTGIRVLSSSLIAMPVIVLFFNQNGLDQTQIFLLQSIFAVTAVLFEVPSGYFADRFGRRTSLLCGTSLWVLGWVIYSLSHGFSQLVVGEIVLGFALSFVSGADSALAYDSFTALGNKKGYRKFETRNFLWMGIGGAIASIIGGIVGQYNLNATIFLQLFIAVPTVVLAWKLTEPPMVEEDESKEMAKNVIKVTKYALHGHKEIKWLILYGAVVGTITHTMVWLNQPLFQEMGIAIGWYGFIWAALVSAPLLIMKFTDQYEHLLGKRRALVSFVVIGVVTYVVIGLFQSVWVLPVLLGFSFIRTVFTPILRDYVNELVDSSIRATVLSVQVLAQRLLYVVVGPIIGWVMDVYSLSTALLFSAVLYGLLGLIVLLNMRRFT